MCVHMCVYAYVCMCVCNYIAMAYSNINYVLK